MGPVGLLLPRIVVPSHRRNSLYVEIDQSTCQLRIEQSKRWKKKKQLQNFKQIFLLNRKSVFKSV